MACYHPIKAYYRLKEDGKKDLIFVDDNSLPVLDRDGVLYPGKINLPCGQCLGCRLEYSRQWAIRCMLEASLHENNYFVTLTYNDDHLPFRIFDEFVDPDTGELLEGSGISHPLVKSHPVMFMKRLRSSVKYHFGIDGIKVYYCGEYGDKTGRPHYHLLLFGMPCLNDLEYLFTNKVGSNFYSSQFLSNCWQDEKSSDLGFVVIGDVTFDSCAYVARYILKKQKGQSSSFYEVNGLEPEFCNMSRRPGIARDYYDVHKNKIYKIDELTLVGSKGKPIQCKPPKYFDSIFGFEDPDRLKELKRSRQRSAENSMKNQLSKTNLSEPIYLKLKEENRKNSLKLLSRDV